MEATRVKQFEEIVVRFTRWVEQDLSKLTAWNSIDVHIDELLDRDLGEQELINYSLELFGWVLTSLDKVLAGKVVMLMIPLRSSEVLDPEIPAWGSLVSQISRTPPSIYVMNVTAFLQRDRTYRYIAATDVPSLGNDDGIAPYYQCWRNPDDPVEDGWARDLRVVSTRFL
jgi:hypothetical protein